MLLYSVSQDSVVDWGVHSGPLEDLNRQSSPKNGWGEAYQYSAAALTETVTMAFALGVKVFERFFRVSRNQRFVQSDMALIWFLALF